MGTENVDAAVMECLDAVDDVIRRRHELNVLLAQGWMEIARARYSMGPSRINESLFSLRPHSPLISIHHGEGNSFMELDVACKDSKREDPQENRVDPLCWFGGLVSPHLRTSQQCFQRVLHTLMEVVNAQKTASSACDNVRSMVINTE